MKTFRSLDSGSSNRQSLLANRSSGGQTASVREKNREEIYNILCVALEMSEKLQLECSLFDDDEEEDSESDLSESQESGDQKTPSDLGKAVQ